MKVYTRNMHIYVESTENVSCGEGRFVGSLGHVSFLWDLKGANLHRIIRQIRL